MPPLVSVLIPCYNAERFVSEAIESALAQTHPNVEVVVVDDGSTDGSRAVIEGFGDRIKYEFGPNGGACAARNRALALSSGEYIQFLDADDLVLPTKFERQLPALVSGPADIVFCKGNLFGDGKPLRPKKRPVRPLGDTDPFDYCLQQGLATEGPLHRRAAVERVGGFREPIRRGQELDLHLRMTAAGARLALVDEVLYSHRDHDGPRITRTPQPPAAHLEMMLDLSLLLEAPPHQMTPARQSALASALHQHAIYAYRNGAPAAAAAGFRRARQLSRRVRYDERGWYKLGAALLGPLAMEWALAAGRKMTGRRAG